MEDSQGGYYKPSSPVLRSEGLRVLQLYDDVASHQQPFRDEASHWTECVAYSRTVMYKSTSTWWRVTSMEPYGAANQAVIFDPINIIEEAFANTCLPFPPGPTLCGDQEAYQVNVCGFLKPPGSENAWQIRMHEAFKTPFNMLGIRHTDQSCHHEVWDHFLHVNARLVDRISPDDKSRRPNSRKRISLCDHSKERMHIGETRRFGSAGL